MKKIFAAAACCACVLASAPALRLARADQTQGQAQAQPPAPCATFSANGYLFDSTFESEEYVNGLLVIHLRLLPKYDDGRNWVTGFNLYSADCTSQFVQSTTPGFAVPAGDINYSIHFTTPTHYEFWDDDDGQQIVEDPQSTFPTWVTDLPATMANGVPYTQVAFNGYVYEQNTGVVSTSAPVSGTGTVQRDPVIIVPGILGTTLQDQDVTLWPNLASMVLDPTSSFMDPLAMSASGAPTDANVVPTSVLDNINYKAGTFHYTDSLVSLFAANGYTANANLFLFSYDWRLSPKDVSGELGAEIQTVLAKTGASRVDIVAHSLGGLVLKQYLSDIHTSNPAAENQIGKVVFVAVPNLGSAEAAKALIFGSNFGVPLLGEAEIQKLALNMPSIYSLLPSADYYNYIAGFYDDLANTQVKQILNHDQAESLLLGLGKNQKLLAAADALHSTSLDEFDFSSKPYSAYNIVGCGVFTLKTIDRMYSGTGNLLSTVFKGPKYRIYADSGDGTVLVPSAAHMAVPAGNTYYVSGAQHATMLSNTAAASQVLEILAGSPIQTAQGVAQSSSSCQLAGKLISYNQGMDITITDVTTGAPVDPSSFPSEDVDTGKNVFIPTGNGQVYVVTLTPQPAAAQTESQAAAPAPVKEDVSVSQIANQTVTVDDYDNVPASAQDPITVGVGDGTATVTQANPNDTTTAVAPSTSFDQGTLATATALVTTIRAYVGQQVPSGGVLQLGASDPRVQFTVSDPTNFLSYGYSFDGGSTFTVSTDPQAVVSVPAGTGSVTFYSLSKDDIAEVPQSVAIDWINVPQTVVEQEPSSPPTVVVEPAEPVVTPMPALTSTPDTDDAGSDSEVSVPLSAVPTADDDSADSQVSVQPDKSIPPIDINITVRQPSEPPEPSDQQPAVLGASVDNIAPTPTSAPSTEHATLFAKGISATSSSILGKIWKAIAFIAHLMFI